MSEVTCVFSGESVELHLVAEKVGKFFLLGTAPFSVPLTSTTKSSAYRMGRNTSRPALRS